jgi:hypothetical protein
VTANDFKLNMGHRSIRLRFLSEGLIARLCCCKGVMEFWFILLDLGLI